MGSGCRQYLQIGHSELDDSWLISRKRVSNVGYSHPEFLRHTGQVVVPHKFNGGFSDVYLHFGLSIFFRGWSYGTIVLDCRSFASSNLLRLALVTASAMERRHWGGV